MSILRAPIAGKLPGAYLLLISISILTWSIFSTGNIPENKDLTNLILFNGFFLALLLYLDPMMLAMETGIKVHKRRFKGKWKVPEEELTTSPFLSVTTDRFLGNSVFLLSLMIGILLAFHFASEDPNPEIVSLCVVITGIILLVLMAVRVAGDGQRFVWRYNLVWRYYSALNDRHSNKEFVENLRELLKRQEWGEARVAIRDWDRATYTSYLKSWREEKMERVQKFLDIARGNVRELPSGKLSWKEISENNVIPDCKDRSLDEIEWKNRHRKPIQKPESFSEDLTEFSKKFKRWQDKLNSLRGSIYNFWNKRFETTIMNFKEDKDKKSSWNDKREDLAGRICQNTVMFLSENQEIASFSPEEILLVGELTAAGSTIVSEFEHGPIHLFEGNSPKNQDKVFSFIDRATEKHNEEWMGTWKKTSNLGKAAVAFWENEEFERRSIEIYEYLKEEFEEEDQEGQEEINP